MSETTQLRVLDFDCPTCASTVERGLGNVEGVNDVEVHYTTGRVEIDFDDGVADLTFRFRRTDTAKTVEVTYHVSDVPDGGPAMGNLRRILDGTADEGDRELFGEAWHGRVRKVLSDDSLFTVTAVKE